MYDLMVEVKVFTIRNTTKFYNYSTGVHHCSRKSYVVFEIILIPHCPYNSHKLLYHNRLICIITDIINLDIIVYKLIK